MTSKTTPLKSIKNYCRYSCCSNDTLAWKDCSVLDCPLYQFRMGVKNYSKKRIQEKKQAVLSTDFKEIKGVEYE